MELVDPRDIPEPPYTTPDCRLSRLCAVFQDMERICSSMRGMGVSGPQIGIPWRIFVYWSNFPDSPPEFCRMVDCSYEPLSGTKLPSAEGCLSLGRDKFILDRYDAVRVSGKIFVEKDGKMLLDEFTRDFSGIFAAIMQHEIDHCDGVFVDTVGRRVSIS